MAYHDWNGNGENDKLDDNIAYRFFKSKNADSGAERKAVKRSTVFIVLAVAVCLLCSFIIPTVTETDADVLWENAMYTENAEFGTGSKTIVTEVIVNDKSVTFEIHTDKTTVGEALAEHNIISGEPGPYGLYVKYVNGILADYDVDKSYWSFTKSGQYMTTGVDVTELADGDYYELVYTK